MGELIDTVSKKNLIVVTGESSCVGVSGLALAGGKGPLSRLYGMACDNIISLKIINYMGEIIEASSKKNCDLYWALKGAGICNFGVVIEIKLKLYDDIYCQIKTLKWDWNPKKIKLVLLLYNKWILTIPGYITADLNIMYNNKTATFSITFYKFNNIHFNEIDEFINLNNPEVTNCEGYYSKITDCWVSYDTGKNMPFGKIKSTMIFKSINVKYFDIIITSINKLLKLKYNLVFQYNFTQLGGQVENGNSAYYPKSASIALTIFINWTYQDLSLFSLAFINKIYKYIVPYTSKYLFPNMIDYDIVNYMNAYYGKNKHRLINIKKIYDPDNLFNWRQSIPTYLKELPG